MTSKIHIFRQCHRNPSHEGRGVTGTPVIVPRQQLQRDQVTGPRHRERQTGTISISSAASAMSRSIPELANNRSTTTSVSLGNGEARRTVASRPFTSCSIDATSRYPSARIDRTRPSAASSSATATAMSTSRVNRGSVRADTRTRRSASTPRLRVSSHRLRAEAPPLAGSSETGGEPAYRITHWCARPIHPPLPHQCFDLVRRSIRMLTTQLGPIHLLAKLIHLKHCADALSRRRIAHATSLANHLALTGSTCHERTATRRTKARQRRPHREGRTPGRGNTDCRAATHGNRGRRSVRRGRHRRPRRP